MNTSTQVLHALRWNAAGRLSAQLGTWLITIFVMRLLTPVDYGLTGLVAILMGFCSLINSLAVPALIQRTEIDQTLVRKIFALVLLTNAILFAAAVAGASYFAGFFGEPRLVSIIRVSALNLMLGALYAVPEGLMQREMKFKPLSIVDFTATIIGSITTLVLALHDFGVWSLVLGNTVRWACTAAALVVVTRFYAFPLFNFSGLREILSFGLKVSGARIIWYINGNLDGLLIGKVLGEHLLGLYSVANTLALLPSSKVMSLSNQIAFAAYSRIQEDRPRVLKYYLESVQLASFVFFPVCWGMSAIADDLVEVVLGTKWHGAIPALQIIALGVPYRMLFQLMDPLVTGLGEPQLSLRNTVTTTIIVGVSMVIGLGWGLIGVCVASLIGFVLAVTINLRRNLALLNVGYGRVMSVCMPSLLAAAGMYATVFGARATLLSGMSPALRLPPTVALGVLAYSAITLAFNRGTAVRSLQVVRGSI